LKRENKDNEAIGALLEEIGIFEKKKEAIFREIEKLGENPNPKKIQSLAKQIRKLINNFNDKLEDIEKITEKIQERR
jgi:predicted  nucleic acid-binding Zn-ribbon protein